MNGDPPSPPLVETTGSGAVAVLRFGRPPLHLLTSDLYRELRRTLRALSSQGSLRVLIVTGRDGSSFSAGSDVNELTELHDAAAEKKVMLENLALRDLEAFPIPTIAAINGYALGGGFELALACDLRILAEDARVGLPEAHIGGVASSGAQRLCRLVGPSIAKQLLFLGEPLRGHEAKQLGLVNFVCSPGAAIESAYGVAERIAAVSPSSNRLAKRLVAGAPWNSTDDGFARSVLAQEEAFQGPDLAEGVAAFRAKRTPNFQLHDRT